MNIVEQIKLFGQERSLVVLIAANLLTLYAVLFLGWSAYEVVLVYCLESIIIGIYNVLKMFTANSQENHWGAKLFLIPFFIVHYNLFMFGQLFFVNVLMDGANPNIDQLHNKIFGINSFLIYTLGGLIMSHGFSFFTNYLGNDEHKKASLNELMFSPYKRVFIQQIVIILGAFIFMSFNTSNVFVILLILLKIITDASTHYLSHKKFKKKS